MCNQPPPHSQHTHIFFNQRRAAPPTNISTSASEQASTYLPTSLFTFLRRRLLLCTYYQKRNTYRREQFLLLKQKRKNCDRGGETGVCLACSETWLVAMSYGGSVKVCVCALAARRKSLLLPAAQFFSANRKCMLAANACLLPAECPYCQPRAQQRQSIGNRKAETAITPRRLVSDDRSMHAHSLYFI